MRSLLTTKSKTAHKIALYIRVSTEEQASNPEGSIKSQEQRLRSFVDLRNQQEPFGEVTVVFIDRARSGKDTNRPELQRLLNAIVNREITMVMVSELSRLSRSIKDFCEIWNLMQQHGCQFQSLREQFDTTTAAGEMVLYSIANIAQFERKQTSERISANFKARAERGLYNGGSAPFGYQIEPEKKGYLKVHEEDATIIREAFATFLREGSLARTAKSLNERGFRLTRRMQGGGKVRLGHFTVDNVHKILTNKTYLGIRLFRSRGELKESKATWPAIVNEDVFNRVNYVLSETSKHRRWRYKMKRFPYLLSGIVSCGKCGDRLPGKSAHGNGGKFPYYEHSWALRREACLTRKFFNCKPIRVSAQKLEREVWDKVEALALNEKLAQDLIFEAQKIHQSKNHVKESDALRKKARAIEDQIGALTDHLAQIPKGMSPAPIFSKMQELQELKGKTENNLNEIMQSGQMMDMPAAFSDYATLIAKVREIMVSGESDLRPRIIQKLVHQVQVVPEGYKIHYLVGKNQVRPTALGMTTRPESLDNRPSLKSVNGSKILLTGGGHRARTYDLRRVKAESFQSASQRNSGEPHCVMV